jgi:hypothetical protein
VDKYSMTKILLALKISFHSRLCILSMKNVNAYEILLLHKSNE